MQKRWKSPVVWTSIAALILLLLKNYGLLEPLGLTEDVFNQIINLLLTILIGVGILNNPTEKEKF